MFQKTVLFRGGGDIASASIYKLKKSGLRVVVCELEKPTCVRRKVSFCNAIFEDEWEIQGETSRYIQSLADIEPTLDAGLIPVLTIPDRDVLDFLKPDVFIDATISRKCLITTHRGRRSSSDSAWIVAGVRAHVVVETQRGHLLGSLIRKEVPLPTPALPFSSADTILIAFFALHTRVR